ncbi:MAG: HAD-IIB family hydrolase, partial [Parcubacteria group bacterium]|nr:HAD-IIB family hydrolase [Parcubacteria group bacterium]
LKRVLFPTFGRPTIPTDKDIEFYATIKIDFMENLLREINQVPKGKKLIVFDLDGTLVETKSSLDAEMADLLGRLLAQKQVAVIGGASFERFKKDLVDRLNASPELLGNLFLFPTTASSFYRYENGEWQEVYSEKFTDEEKQKIIEAFEKAFKEINYIKPEKTYGEIIEDRGSQITFSALGQDVVKELGEEGIELKKKWRDENQDFKFKLAEILQKYLPEFEVRAAGYTSIDITRKGIDKEYGIKQIQKYLGVSVEDMLFVGDALFEGGNDYAALKTGVLCFEIKEVEETKKLVRYLLSE